MTGILWWARRVRRCRERRASDTTRGTLAEFDTRANTLTRKLPAGAYPHGIAVTQDGSHAYVVLSGQAAVAYVDLRS
ncbi:YncE family protein [Amycolatopsis speibonae]|uniref:YncE family protein n=1 Tax=Amycolatopsis speibonae TaxID=1450224 RepID=A0ABV7P620_9PSEU